MYVLPPSRVTLLLQASIWFSGTNFLTNPYSDSSTVTAPEINPRVTNVLTQQKHRCISLLEVGMRR